MSEAPSPLMTDRVRLDEMTAVRSANAGDDEWSYNIINAISKIQMFYAVEQDLTKDIPRDYLTIDKRLKFFFSGFSNSNAPRSVWATIWHSLFNYEIWLMLFLIVVLKVYAIHNGSYGAFSAMFALSYITIIGYSLYLSSKWRFAVFGKISGTMMFLVLWGRTLFLFVTAFFSTIILWFAMNFLENNPKFLYVPMNFIYKLLGKFGLTDNIWTLKESYVFTFEYFIPALKYAAIEMIVVFCVFGLIPILAMLFARFWFKHKNAKEQELFENS